MVDEPITKGVRELAVDMSWPEIIDHVRTSSGAVLDGDWLDAWHEAMGNACDAVDAVHARLEAENARLREELNRVPGGREDEPTSIGEATITITPRLDLSEVAHGLRAAAGLLEGPAAPLVASDPETDGATGWCACGACGRPIDPWDRYCRHCGMGVEA